jgi:hypothetical protein
MVKGCKPGCTGAEESDPSVSCIYCSKAGLETIMFKNNGSKSSVNLFYTLYLLFYAVEDGSPAFAGGTCNAALHASALERASGVLE